MQKISVFWFRRDLRLVDNKALFKALSADLNVLPIFIFDSKILEKLDKEDPRVNFIYSQLEKINQELQEYGSGVKIWHDTVLEAWKTLTSEYQIAKVYTNEDYEPYALERDSEVRDYLESKEIEFCQYKDQVIFRPGEILKADGKPYTVFTPYKKKWLERVVPSDDFIVYDSHSILKNCLSFNNSFPNIETLGFEKSRIQVNEPNLLVIDHYDQNRDFPMKEGTSYLGPHLRFGTVSIRILSHKGWKQNSTFLSELIWREFFMQILFHFPRVIDESFKTKYDRIEWQNNESDFELWKKGNTGYPMVDAGMRQLNKTGYMHNRVRMVVASFLCKHLLIDWRWGEAYFAEKLLDFDLASNNGNWQWAAGTGCDASPYFRVFNPELQMKKFDPELKYIRNWIEDFDELTYPNPMVDHKMARNRAIEVYKKGLEP